MRIAFVADPESPNGWYRGIGPMVALAARGHDVRQVLRLNDVFRPEALDGCDLLHIHRYHDERTMRLAKSAKARGMAVVWDNDDDLTAAPRNNVAYRAFGGARGARAAIAIRRLVQLADLVTTPSRRLADLYREQGAADVEVIENFVRDEMVRSPSRDGERLMVGWLAGKEHHVDAERLPIRDTLQRLLDARSDVAITTIGVGLGLQDERYTHIPRVRFFELGEVLAPLSIGIAPLADMAHNRARSNVKLKEYAACGVPWLASSIGPYVGLGSREGGRLVAEGEWYDALDRLVSSGRERRKLQKRAAKWGRGQTVSANVTQWEALLRRTVQR